MAHSEACQLFIEQEIKEKLAQGKTPTEGFDPAILKKKISSFHRHMNIQPTKQSFVEMLEGIFNRQAHIKIPLAFNAEEAARKRVLSKTEQ